MNNFNNQRGWENTDPVYAEAANFVHSAQRPDGLTAGDMVFAMAYVRRQPWEETYDDETGFNKGTIFPSLDYPWIGEGGGSAL